MFVKDRILQIFEGKQELARGPHERPGIGSQVSLLSLQRHISPKHVPRFLFLPEISWLRQNSLLNGFRHRVNF